MFPAEKDGEWEPYKVRRKGAENGAEPKPESNGANGDEEGPVFEEDFVTEEGATWPIQEGSIVDWSCFFALLTHVYNQLSPPFHTPILLISEPAWTLRDHEKITQFVFEKFRPPGFAMMDSAQAACWAYGVHTATVIDIGLGKADITAVSEYVTHDTGRTIALKNCGGEAMTQRLLELLGSKGLSREMCEQLKKNPICELLPPGTPLPGSGEQPKEPANPAAAASTGVDESGPDARDKAQEAGVPRGPGPDTEVGEEQDEGEKEGVLDVASIVAGGKMNEYLAQKEKEKNEKLAAKKKGGAADAAAAAKPIKLANSKRQKASFMYEDHALLDTLKGMNLSTEEMANAHAGLDEGVKRAAPDSVPADGMATAGGEVQPAGTTQANGVPGRQSGSIRREIEVGTERFQAASGGILDRIADAIHRTICKVEEVNKRSELWDSLIIVGNGARVRGTYRLHLQRALALTLHRFPRVAHGDSAIQVHHLTLISDDLHLRNTLQCLNTRSNGCKYSRSTTRSTWRQQSAKWCQSSSPRCYDCSDTAPSATRHEYAWWSWVHARPQQPAFVPRADTEQHQVCKNARVLP